MSFIFATDGGVPSTSDDSPLPLEIERRTVGRIGYRLIPFLMLCYGIAYLARVNLSYAAVQMNKDEQEWLIGQLAAERARGGAALLLSIALDDPTARIAAISVAFAGTLAFTSPFWSIPGSFLTGGAVEAGVNARCS